MVAIAAAASLTSLSISEFVRRACINEAYEQLRRKANNASGTETTGPESKA